MFAQIRKRDGRVVDFDASKITKAIFKAAKSMGGQDRALAESLAQKVVERAEQEISGIPTVEQLQDIVEKILIEEGHAKTAKAYILYRNERAKVREKQRQVPEHVRALVADSKKHFRNPLSEFIYFRTYSRWIEEEGRRETWIETVDRYMAFMKENLGRRLTEAEYAEVREGILRQEAMPSMRLLWSAGKAARSSNVTAYNCSFIAPTKLEDFAEIMYLSMCGAGVGFSVESEVVQQLPIIKRQSGEKLPTHVVQDSKEGWGNALTLGLRTWFDGKDIEFDFSRLRLAGARLNTMGGRSSGPGVLRDLLAFARAKILSRQGKRLRNIDVHDVICKIGEVVVMGGVRRTALISLSDLDDEEMRHAKTGQFYLTEPQRSMANNSAVYLEKPSATVFLDEWLSLAKSGTGERGIFNRGGLKQQLPERRWEMMGSHSSTVGTNPCGEILLRSKEFCNLSEVVARKEDTEQSLLRKVRLATIIGTFQSTLTNFPYLSREWKENCEEERLLGVSLTGQWDSPAARNPETLRKMRQVAITTNQNYASRFGINESVCITCVKPSGCRPWYALTATDRGLLTLEELFAHHREDKEWDAYPGPEQVLQNPHPAKILKTYQNGTSRLLRIKMSYGLTVESTPNHQWFVSYHYDRKRGTKHQKMPVQRWVEARHLRPGDIIELRPGVYENRTPAALRKVESATLKMRGDAAPIAQPKEMNQDLAWLLGYLWGDGAMSPGKYRIRFIDQRTENLRKAQRVIKEQFGLDAAVHRASEHRKAHTLEVGSKLLWHWLIKNDVFKYYADRIDVIPTCVRASARADIIAFLAGLLDSDGWVGTHSNKRGFTLTLTTADTFFAQHVQDVAWAVGLGFGRSLNSAGKNFQKQKRMYLLTLGRAVQKDAFDALLRNSTKLQAAATAGAHWLWENEKDNALIPGKVLGLEDGGVAPTYDIEVEKHWYWAGCAKSHNTVSQLVDASSGMHPRHAKYYIRRVRISATDPFFQMLKEQKFPCQPEVGQSPETAATWVLEFPVKAPESAVVKDDLTALDQLAHWKLVKENFTEHNPSVTVSVGANEWIATANWLYQNWDILGGLSFLPRSDHVYQLAPYEEIDQARYEELMAALPKVDFSNIVLYEKEDQTIGSKELACAGGACEISPSEGQPEMPVAAAAK